jgi:hypothetical protein
MSNYGNLQSASRLGRSIVTAVATAQVQVTQSTTAFGAQTRHVRVVHTLTAGIWATIDSTTTDITANSSSAFVPANWPEYFGCSPGQHLNFLCTSTSTGYVVLSEMT